MHIFNRIILLGLFIIVHNSQTMEVPNKNIVVVKDQKKIEESPLYIANKLGNYAAAKKLIALGVPLTFDSEHKKIQGYSCLLFALHHRNLVFFDYVLEEEKIDINRQDKNVGFTILHDVAIGWFFKFANQKGWPEKPVANLSNKDLINFLLSRGADPSIVDNTGRFPYEYTKDKEIRNILMQEARKKIKDRAKLECASNTESGS